MEKIITIINKNEQEKADKEYWRNASAEERFEAFNIILQNYIALTYGTDPGFQRVIKIVKRVRYDKEIIKNKKSPEEKSIRMKKEISHKRLSKK